MPKHMKRNAFYYYVKRFKKDEEGRGRVFLNGWNEVADAASPKWTVMDKEERAPYVKKAKKYDTEYPVYDRRELNTLGIPIAEMLNAEKQRAEAKAKATKTIISLLEKIYDSDTLTTTPFYIMSANYFVKDLAQNYYPAEIGMVKFNIEKGITRKWHDLINPGKLPMGYAFQAKDHSEKVHKLTPPPNAIGETNLNAIMTNITEFMVQQKTVEDDKKFYIFVLEEETAMIRNILVQLCETLEVNLDHYVLLPVEELFFYLRKKCEKKYGKGHGSVFNVWTAKALIDKDVYLYCSGNGCQFHEEEGDDINPHCALAKPTRWAYTILAHTLEICGIEDQKRAFHFPVHYKSSFEAPGTSDGLKKEKSEKY